MQLKAISIGCAVPRADFEAAIHSVFDSALNLRPARGAKLLTLVASGEPDLPQAIRVNTPDDFSFEIFRAGGQAACRDHVLHLGSSTIELRGARRWKCDLAALHADMTDPAAAAAWKRTWHMLNRRQKLLGAEIIAEDLFRSDGTIQAAGPRRAGEAVRSLIESTRRFDPAAVASIDTLVGLGTGLTPSGDDLLVGYMAGLWCAILDKRERGQFASTLGGAVIRLSRKTNDISRTYLHHAARGQVSSRLAELAGAICRGENSDRLPAAAESAMQAGHTSGMDAVTGLLAGLAAWSSPGTPCREP